MIRIGVYNGDTHKRGLTLHNFTVLNQLEDTKSPVEEFNLVGRYMNFKEHLMKDRIYLVNVQDPDPSKPIIHYEVLDKVKFIKYTNDDFIITYKRYSGQSIIDLYEARTNEIKEYLDWIVKRGKQKEGKRTRLNTFTKSVLERIFKNYGYFNVIRYDNKNELDKWQKSILQKVKNFNRKREDEKTNWSEEEIELLILEMAKDPQDRMSEKELAARLGRTVPSIATKKWKLKTDDEKYKSKYLNMNDRAKLISEKLKNFRKEKGWSQGKLSRESRVSLSIVNQLECMNYNNTDTTKVNDLLKYLDNNSEHIIIHDLPASDSTTADANIKSNPKGKVQAKEPKKESNPAPSLKQTHKQIENTDKVVEELKHLSDKIDNVLRSNITLQIKNNKLESEKENLIKLLTSYISEKSLEQAV